MYVLNQNAHCNILKANFCTYIFVTLWMRSELGIWVYCYFLRFAMMGFLETSTEQRTTLDSYVSPGVC